VLKELAPYKNLVVSTGGGAVTAPMNWSYMHNGIVCWLEGPPDLLARRVVAEGVEKRPLLYGAGAGGRPGPWLWAGRRRGRDAGEGGRGA
jgi:shikimate kinase